jgi:hypothetical protein
MRLTAMPHAAAQAAAVPMTQPAASQCPLAGTTAATAGGAMS